MFPVTTVAGISWSQLPYRENQQEALETAKHGWCRHDHWLVWPLKSHNWENLPPWLTGETGSTINGGSNCARHTWKVAYSSNVLKIGTMPVEAKANTQRSPTAHVVYLPFMLSKVWLLFSLLVFLFSQSILKSWFQSEPWLPPSLIGWGLFGEPFCAIDRCLESLSKDAGLDVSHLWYLWDILLKKDQCSSPSNNQIFSSKDGMMMKINIVHWPSSTASNRIIINDIYLYILIHTVMCMYTYCIIKTIIFAIYVRLCVCAPSKNYKTRFMFFSSDISLVLSREWGNGMIVNSFYYKIL